MKRSKFQAAEHAQVIGASLETARLALAKLMAEAYWLREDGGAAKHDVVSQSLTDVAGMLGVIESHVDDLLEELGVTRDTESGVHAKADAATSSKAGAQ